HVVDGSGLAAEHERLLVEPFVGAGIGLGRILARALVVHEELLEACGDRRGVFGSRRLSAAKPHEGESDQCSPQTASGRRAEREKLEGELHGGHGLGSSWGRENERVAEGYCGAGLPAGGSSISL